MKILYIVLAAALGAGLVKAYDHFSALKLSTGDAIVFSVPDNDKQIPLINLDANGILLIDIPKLMKQHQENLKKAPAASPAPKK